jgi:four helix bundle protein
MKKSFKDLDAWLLAMDLAVEVYRSTIALPAEERFGLTAQMRSAGVSVPSNVAEGAGRLTWADFCRFLGQSRGSLNELETQVELARRLGFLSEEESSGLNAHIARTGQVLNGLIRFTKKKRLSPSKLKKQNRV